MGWFGGVRECRVVILDGQEIVVVQQLFVFGVLRVE